MSMLWHPSQMEAFPCVEGKVLFSYFLPFFHAGIPWNHILHFLFCSGFAAVLPLPSHVPVRKCWGNCLLCIVHFHLVTGL